MSIRGPPRQSPSPRPPRQTTAAIGCGWQIPTKIRHVQAAIVGKRFDRTPVQQDFQLDAAADHGYMVHGLQRRAVEGLFDDVVDHLMPAQREARSAWRCRPRFRPDVEQFAVDSCQRILAGLQHREVRPLARLPLQAGDSRYGLKNSRGPFWVLRRLSSRGMVILPAEGHALEIAAPHPGNSGCGGRPPGTSLKVVWRSTACQSNSGRGRNSGR